MPFSTTLVLSASRRTSAQNARRGDPSGARSAAQAGGLTAAIDASDACFVVIVNAIRTAEAGLGL
jgi:hypothetical protein